MKILARALILAGLLSCLMTAAAPVASAEPTRKTVLVLSPFQVDLSTNLIASQAIREEFGKATDLKLDIYYENLDLNRFSDATYQQNIFDLLTVKYKNKQVDLVIVGSESMLKLWLAQRAEILPNTTIVFFDVFTEHLDALDLPGNVTGVSGTEDCTKSIRWLLEAMPEVNEVVLVMGAGKIEQGFFDHIQKLQEHMKGQVKFTNLSGLPLAEITQQVAKLPKTSIVLYHPMFEDAEGNKYRPLEVLQELTTVSSVPVMGGYDQFIGTGIIGGYMYSIDQQARDAAQISLRVLLGEAIDSISIEQNESDRFIFDHLALQRFDIPLSLLPADSIIKNRQYSFWELYRTQIILAIAGFAFLMLLVVFLGITTQRLSKARSELKHLNDNLEFQVQERTAALRQTNRDLEQEVAERQQAETALQESEARFRSYFELPLTGRAITSPDKGWIDVNATLCEMLGYTKPELIQLTWAELTHPDDIAADLVQFNRVLAGEIEGYDLEKRFLCKDGHVIHTHLAIQCLRNPDRSVDYIVALILDVTEHKKAEEKLHESEEKFRSLLDSQESSIMMYDFDGVHHYVNQGALATMTNGTSQDIIGKRLHDLYPAHIADWQLEQIRQVFATGKGFSGDFRTGPKNHASWWHLNLQPIRNPSGHVMQVMVNSLDITERKHAEAALKNSELFINGVLNSLTAQIAVLDEDGVIISVNESWKNFAVSNDCPDPACYIGANYLTVCEAAIYAGDQSAEAMLGGMRAVLAGSQTQFIQEYPCDAPGIPRWFTVTVLPQSQPRKGLIVVHQDISERKLAEQALQESEKRTATILRLSPAVIGVSTVAEGRYTDVNDAFENVLGYSPAEIIGRTSFDLNLWVDDDARSNVLREIQTRGRVENLEIRLRRKSGEVFPALIFITPITLHNTACLLTMMMDITERKRAEEQLRETRDTLQTIIYSSPLTILTFDSEDRITMWNPAAESMFGWSEKQTLGQIDPTVPENKLRESDALRNATMSGMSFSNMDTVRMKNDGEQFHVSLSVAPLRGQENEVIGRLHIITDITERKKLQEELRQQATTDELTKVSNRRHFIELANSEIKRAIRLKRPPAFALIDIDHFKQINDTYGHATGDLALIEFTKICQKQIREIDVLARFGGDEFVLLFPETNKEQAYEIVERIRLALMKTPVDLEGEQVVITLSCGIASLGDEQKSLDTLLNRADQALYHAKEAGRNRVVIEAEHK